MDETFHDRRKRLCDYFFSIYFVLVPDQQSAISSLLLRSDDPPNMTHLDQVEELLNSYGWGPIPRARSYRIV